MKKVVYLVEDNFEISELIDYLLTGIGMEVKTFATVTDFTAALKLSLPNLIILDIMLPDGNGIDVCREIKANGHRQSIPILLMSAHINIKTRALESGVEDFISKPFDIDDFIRKIEQYIG